MSSIKRGFILDGDDRETGVISDTCTVDISKRKIPCTMATQVSDNISPPFWALKDNVTVSDDFLDCYVAFKEFDCQEYLWDWQGRQEEEVLVRKLLNSHSDYFKQKPIGKNKFITFRIPDIAKETIETMGKIYMTIINIHNYAMQNGFHKPPVFELVVHSPNSADRLVKFANLYNESVVMASEAFKSECGPKAISLIPVSTNVARTDSWFSTLNEYICKYQNNFRCKLDYFRPFIPRSSYADSVGSIAATLFTKRCISMYARIAKETGVESCPIIESGPLQFRGGLSPENYEGFLLNYEGVTTVTITPSFRYDYKLSDVKKAISGINIKIGELSAPVRSVEELEQMYDIELLFARNFKSTMQKISKQLETFSIEQSFSTFDKKQEKTVVLYSLGIPPELIGVGRTLIELIRNGMIIDFEKFYPRVKQDLIEACVFLNKENLEFLSKLNAGFAEIKKDMQLVEDYTGTTLGPRDIDSVMHRNHTSNVFHLWGSGKNYEEEVLKAARLRKTIG